MSRHQQPASTRRVSALPRHLVRLRPIQIGLVAAGLVLLVLGVLARSSFTTATGDLRTHGTCVDATVTQVAWQPRSLPDKLIVTFADPDSPTRTATAWSDGVEDRTTVANGDDPQQWHAGDGLRVCVDGKTFASPSGSTVSGDLVLRSSWLLPIVFGLALFAVSIALSVVAWRDAEDGT
jgi:hypothetical protein